MNILSVCKRAWGALVVLLFVFGCTNDVDKGLPPQDGLHEVVFHAGWDPETKTVLQEDLSVWWSPGDAISLFNGDYYDGGYRLVSNNAEPADRVDFIGQIGVLQNGSKYVAVYPFNESNYYGNGSSCRVTIPHVQQAKEGTFAEGAFVSVAVSENDYLYFRNVCSGFKFSVNHDNIKAVTFTPISSETLAGRFFINISDIDNIDMSPVNYSDPTPIIVEAPDDGCFQPGKYYYVALASRACNGLEIGFINTENKKATFRMPDFMKFNRGVIKKLYEKDKGLKFTAIHNNPTILNNISLPDGVDKTKITEVSFVVNSDKTTIISIPTSSPEPIYFELDGTVAKYYTGADVYNLVNAYGMFRGWTSLRSVDLSNVNTSGVTSMRAMFSRCISLESITFGEFCTDNVNDMGVMFNDCWSLESLDLSSFNTSKVTSMDGMFSGCSSLASLDLSSFDTSNVEDMAFMFGPGIDPLSPSYERGFRSCSDLTSLDLSHFNTEKVANFSSMFSGASNLKSINLAGWNTSSAEYMSDMFSGCSSLKNIDLSSFDTERVIEMTRMFMQCTSLESVNVSSFSTQNVLDMRYMFYACESLPELDISSFNCSSARYVERMLSHCFKIRKLDLGNIDFSNAETKYGLMTWSAKYTNGIAIRCNANTKETILDNGAPSNPESIIWVNPGEAIPDIAEYRNPNLYYSSDYDMHRKVKQLQSATVGKGVDIVILGDAYSDRLIADGTYEADMTAAIEGLFEYEPLKTYRDYFNVYMLYVVSENESCEGLTAFHISESIGESGIVNSCVLPVVKNKSLSDIAIVVVGHDTNAFTSPGLAVSAYSWDPDGADDNDYGQAQYAIAYVARDPDDSEYTAVLAHEFGHMFAKLADEYVEIDATIESSAVQNFMRSCQHAGLFKNIDFTNDPDVIKWGQFLADPRYTNERVGAYEGGYLYARGMWRPTEESIMRNHLWKHGFNAPSREAIYYRINKLAYGKDWQYDYETFVQQDLKNIPAEPYFQSSPRYVPYPARVPQKHLFKVEESIDPDGGKMITVIMD